jgi:hypothetical protein
VSEPDSDTTGISTLRKWIIWAAVVGTALWAGYFFIFLIYQSIVGSNISDNWFIRMVQEHPAATIGVAMSAVTAFCLVAILEISRGPIEFEALGFKFRGASGPVVLWVLCFLVMIFGVWLLWDKSSGVIGKKPNLETSASFAVQFAPTRALQPTACRCGTRRS